MQYGGTDLERTQAMRVADRDRLSLALMQSRTCLPACLPGSRPSKALMPPRLASHCGWPGARLGAGARDRASRGKHFGQHPVGFDRGPCGPLVGVSGAGVAAQEVLDRRIDDIGMGHRTHVAEPVERHSLQVRQGLGQQTSHREG